MAGNNDSCRVGGSHRSNACCLSNGGDNTSNSGRALRSDCYKAQNLKKDTVQERYAGRKKS